MTPPGLAARHKRHSSGSCASARPRGRAESSSDNSIAHTTPHRFFLLCAMIIATTPPPSATAAQSRSVGISTASERAGKKRCAGWLAGRNGCGEGGGGGGTIRAKRWRALSCVKPRVFGSRQSLANDRLVAVRLDAAGSQRMQKRQAPA